MLVVVGIVVTVIAVVVPEREVAGALVERPVVIPGDQPVVGEVSGRDRDVAGPLVRRAVVVIPIAGVSLADEALAVDATEALGLGESPAKAMVPPITSPPINSNATAAITFRTICMSSSSVVDLVEIAYDQGRERRVTGCPEAGKGGGKPQSSSCEPESSEPEPELPEPDPELSEPGPELPPESSLPAGSSDPPPWSSADGDGVSEPSSSADALGDREADADPERVGCTIVPTSPASASAPTVSAIAAASPPMPSTIMATTRFMSPR